MQIGLSKGLRIAILCTAIWLVLLFVLSLGMGERGEYFDAIAFTSNFLIFGILPALFTWGIIWVRAASPGAAKIEDFLVGIPLAPEIRCPRCSASMKLKTTKSGSNAGKVFWGCSRFPTCIQIAPLAAGP